MARSSFTRDVPPFGDRASSGGSGPTPPASVDRFEATIIVGNVPNGDPATAQTGAFAYVPDTGNGVGLATALSDAAASGLPTRIRLRPGTYDFSLSGTGLPRTIPSNVTLEGSGEGVTIVAGRAASRAVFEVAENANLRDLTITLPNPAGNVSGARVVRLAQSAIAERVTIEVGDNTGTQDDDSLRACFDLQGLYARVLDCLAIYNPLMFTATDSPQVAYYAIGPRTSGPVVGDVYVRGRGRGAGELVFVAPSVGLYALELQGICAAAGTINGTQGRGTIQATVQNGGRPGALQLAGLGNLFDLSIYDGDGASIDGYITCSSSRSTYRVSLEGAGIDGGIVDAGEGNTWTGFLSADASAVFAVDGDVIALDAMRIQAPGSGDIVFGASSLNCSAIGCRISGVTDDTAGGTGNNRALNLEGV